MKIIGLTGGIGSGKTTIAKMFEELGVPVYYADMEAKRLMNTSFEIKNSLIAEFGEKTYQKGVLNRAYLAEIVFNDKEKLQRINAIVHPKVEEDFKNWINIQEGDFVIQENAILFENNKQDRFDYIITVTAPTNLRVERVMNRDHISEYQVIARMKNQMDDAFKIKNSHFVIQNTDLKESAKKVKEIYLKLSE